MKERQVKGGQVKGGQVKGGQVKGGQVKEETKRGITQNKEKNVGRERWCEGVVLLWRGRSSLHTSRAPGMDELTRDPLSTLS